MTLTRSEIMGRVRSKNTKLELTLRKTLHSRGLRYRVNSKLFGKPDISIKKRKLVIFIDSCFWHGCEEHCRLPSTNVEYWERKISRNKERDKEVTSYYLNAGWTVIRVWEHEITKDLPSIADKIMELAKIRD